MTRPDLQETYWNRVAGKKTFTVPFEMDRFGQYVSRSADILDLGCGYGRILNQLDTAGFAALTGVDFSSRMITRGRQCFPGLSLIPMTAGSPAFKDATFDAVLLIAVMTCIETDAEQFNLMRQIHRVLRPGGIIYFSDFLLNKDRRNLDRYHENSGCYGVFELSDGAVLRHHHPDHIARITSGFQTIVFENRVFPTMNGHQSNGFLYIGKNL